MLVPVLVLKLLFSLSLPYDTGFGCHGAQPGIHAVYDKGFNVGGLVLDYSNTEIRSPWREGGYNGEPLRQSRLLMLDSIKILSQPHPSITAIFPTSELLQVFFVMSCTKSSRQLQSIACKKPIGLIYFCI